MRIFFSLLDPLKNRKRFWSLYFLWPKVQQVSREIVPLKGLLDYWTTVLLEG